MKHLTILLILSFPLLYLNGNEKEKDILERKNVTESKKYTSSQSDDLFNKTVFAIIRSYREKDEETLNKYILKEFGIAFLYARGILENITISDKISFADPIPEYLPFESDIEVDNNINFEELPDFSCDTEKWDKASGIYCDTTKTDTSLSRTAKNEKEFLNADWSDDDMTRIETMEKTGRRIIVIDKNERVFIFYLTEYRNKWWLTAIDRFEVCSA